jgi:methionine aminotransferase
MLAPIDVHSKLPQVGTTIFTIMSKMASDHNAINLSQGFPDFPVDIDLLSLVSHYMQAGKNQYAPMTGIPELRNAISRKVAATYGRTYDPDREITITAGATQAIYTAITALVRDGDEVIIFTPAYDCYVPAVVLNGGKPVYIQLTGPDYKVHWDEVKKVVNRKTRLIIINTPHNPTGTVWSENDMRELEKLVVNSTAMVVSDEVYEHIVFDGEAHQGAARFEELAKRSMIVASFGKTFHVTGWKVGYIYGPENLMDEFRKVHQYLVFSVNSAMQYAIAEYLEVPERYLKLPELYQAKRDLFLNAIQPGKFSGIPAMGSYFQLLNYSSVSKKGEIKFAEELTKKHGVAAIPVSVFYHKPLEQYVLRFCFAKSDDVILAAAERLNSL